MPSEIVLFAHHAGASVPVTVVRKQVKHMNLRVRSNGTVTLSIPLRATIADAEGVLERRGAWIFDRLERVRLRSATSPAGSMEEAARTIPLWGALVSTATVLDLPSASASKPPATFGDFIRATPDAQPPSLSNRANDPAARLAALPPEELAQAIDALYHRAVAQALPDIVRELEARMGVHATSWQIRTMKTRWGSCTVNTGAIRINANLAAFPPICLKQVVAHELTHLLETNHTARFHALLNHFYPENRKAIALLKRSAREVAQESAQPR